MQWVLLFALGGAAAALGDLNHVAWGVLSYPGGGQPWWVWPEMGVAALAVAGGYLTWPARLREGHVAWRDVAVPGAWFVGTYLATGPLARWPWALALALVALYAGRVARDRVPMALLYPVAVSVSGPLVEAAISAAGLFSYDAAQLGPVPVWLPALYLHVGLAGRAVARAMTSNA